MSDTTVVYDSKDSVAEAAKMALYSGGVGLFISTIQNALQSHSRGAMGVLTRSGGTIGFFVVMGATYAFTEAYTANLRRQEGPVNTVAGGCAAGLLAGARARSLPVGLASCAVLGALMGTFEVTGASLTGLHGGQGQALQSVEERRKAFFKQRPPQPLPMPSESEASS